MVDFSDLKVQTCSAREESAPEAPRRTPRGGTARNMEQIARNVEKTARNVEQWQEMWKKNAMNVEQWQEKWKKWPNSTCALS